MAESVEIVLNALGRGKLIINGIDLAENVLELRLDARHDSFPVLVLEYACDSVSWKGHADVKHFCPLENREIEHGKV